MELLFTNFRTTLIAAAAAISALLFGASAPASTIVMPGTKFNTLFGESTSSSSQLAAGFAVCLRGSDRR